MRAKITEAAGRAFTSVKNYYSSVDPKTRRRVLVGLLIGTGAISAAAIYWGKFSTSAKAAEAALQQKTDEIAEILKTIIQNDISPGVDGGNLFTDITEEDRETFTNNITDAVLSNKPEKLTPDAIAKELTNLPSAISSNITYDLVMNTDKNVGDGGSTRASIINASVNLTNMTKEIEGNAKKGEEAEQTGATERGGSTEQAGAPGETEPPPISSNPNVTGAGGTGTAGSLGIPSISKTLVDLGYLKTPQKEWTPELESAFGAFMDKATKRPGGYNTDFANGDTWEKVAPLLGFEANVAGAAKAVASLSNSVGSAGSNPDFAATSSGSNTLADIISEMYNGGLTRGLGKDFTRGIDFVNESRRMKILVGAFGDASTANYENAAKVILKKDPGLSADLPKSINGLIDKTYVKQNMDLFKRIQTALNSIISGAFGPLAPPNIEVAKTRMRAFLQTPKGGGWIIEDVTSSQNSQWVKLANERKMKLRLQIAAEMTPAERAAARRIKMREAV
jgi:hypothetical protein